MSTNVVQGRYGFYPCSYELYRKLKRLNFLAFLGRKRDAAWERWNRKLPHNRVIKKRRYSLGCLVTGGPKVRTSDGWDILGPMPEPICSPLTPTQMDQIYTDYRKARFPMVESQVQSLTYSEGEIDRLLVLCENWYAGQSTAA